jgi:hypothetical protein
MGDTGDIMAVDLQNTLENLDRRLRSSTGRDGWRIAVYTLDLAAKPEAPRLRRAEVLGPIHGDVFDLVANAAWTTRATVIGDIGRIAESLHDPAEVAKYQTFGVHEVAAGIPAGEAHGTVIAAPCFDPLQSVTNDRVLRRALGAIAVAGDMPAPEVAQNESLRFLVERYADAVASFLEARPANMPHVFFGGALPDVEVVSPQQIGTTAEGEVVGPSKEPKYWRLVRFPEKTVRITSYSQNFEPFGTRGERWLQFGPGLAVTRSGLEAFVRGWTQGKADLEYVQGIEGPELAKDWTG